MRPLDVLRPRRILLLTAVALISGYGAGLFLTATDAQLVRAASSLALSLLTVVGTVCLAEAAGGVTCSVLNRMGAHRG